jgi:hypothetical protein
MISSQKLWPLDHEAGLSRTECRRYTISHSTQAITTFTTSWSLSYVNYSITELIQGHFRHCLKTGTIPEHLHTHRSNFSTPVTPVYVVKVFWRSFGGIKLNGSFCGDRDFFPSSLFFFSQWQHDMTSSKLQNHSYKHCGFYEVFFVLFSDMKEPNLLP